MIQGPLRIDTSLKRKPNLPAGPVFLIALEPWHKSFLRNLADLLWPRRKTPLRLVSRPASFWPDVFVPTPLPWSRFLQSTFAHVFVIAALWGWSQLWPQRPQIVQRNVFHSSDVVYYDASEYLAPLNTGGTQSQSPKKGEPEHAEQPIISVPPEADNRTQTIVTPPNLKLDRDLSLPNIVAWARSKLTIPQAVLAASPSEVKLPVLPTSVVAPAPDVSSAMKQAPALADSVVAPTPQVNGAISRREVHAPQAAIVEPPREVENDASSRLSDINIGHSQVVAPAPQLPVSEQRALTVASMGNSGAAVVPPPPSVQGSGTSSDERLIALNLHPAAPGAPIDVPAGNRRGTFAATPEGKAGAAGTPDIPADNHHPAGLGGEKAPGSDGSTNGVPPGLFVGTSPKSGASIVGKTSSSDNSPLLASATPPRVTAVPPRSSEVPANAESEVERQLFGGRKSYAMILNVPNLNSAGGSWVMHFAELKDAEKQGDLVAPVATQEVDPGYPLELMRQNVQGTVILSAVIHSNGSVGDVRVLRGVDDRLDGYASAALSRWRFRPATRNGDPVALQTVVMIPFRPMRKSGF
ncbi:MAG TPA: TonB family protein [Terriglobales bacterium]|nr:TonB family protein [Terriglobales bacterium]